MGRPLAEPGGEGLYRRLVRLIALRIALITVLLAASALVLVRSEAHPGAVEQILYGVIVATYAASLVYLWVLRASPALHRRLAYAQVTGDVLISACMVSLTGGAESIVLFLFPLTVVSAAVLLQRRGALFAAALSSATLVALTVTTELGLVLPLSGVAAPAMPPARLAFFLFANVAAIALTAVLASYLSEQARWAHERLSVRENDYYALELLHESIVRSVASGIIAVDRFGIIRFLNGAAEQITSLSPAQALGTPLEKTLPALAERLHAPDGVRHFEVDHLHASGETRRLRCSASPLLDRQARNHGFVLAIEDLTSIRSMEEAVKRSERLAAVGTMAAGLAHELRNPLASMSGSIQLLAEGKQFSADDQRLMGIVLREADRLNALVKEFLQYARPGPAAREPLDLRAVVESTATLFRNDPSRREVVVETQLPEPLPVRGDEGQLGQVLWNLLTNAAEAMPAGGKVAIRGAREGDRIRLCVQDSGEGIARGDLERVFDPFYTTKEHGTGLGLATVHSIVQGHGGEIAVKSEVGRGTTFSIMLPADAQEPPAANRSVG